MSGILKTSLDSLHSVLKIQDSSRNSKASSVIKDIVNFVLDVPEKETGFCSSLLFNEESGVLRFLKLSVGLKEFENVKTDILRFLAEYINPQIKRCNVVHLKAVKEQSLSMFICDHSVKVRNESLVTLTQVLSWEFDDVENELNIVDLANKIWSECLKSSRIGATLRCSIYAIVGLLAEKFPVLMTERSERIPSMFLSFLKMESTKKKPELPVIAGCFRGFTSYLVNFTQTVAEGSKHASGIYKYIKMCISYKNYNRYDALKAGMILLKAHCTQWKELITDDAEVIYEYLDHWSQHINRDVKYLAVDTMDAVLLEISSFIASKGKKENEKYKGILWRFMLKFRGILNSSNATSKELAMAVKGYGKLAEACNLFVAAGDMKKIFEDMVKRTEQCFVSFDGLHDDDLYRLPTFLESLVRILKGLSEISSTCLYPMEKIIVTLLDFYPKLGKNGQELYFKSFTMYIEALSNSPSLLKTSLNNLMYQCIIRTCSHPPIQENDEEFNAKKDLKISFQSFMTVWIELLNMKNYKMKLFGDEEKAASIKELVYDGIIISIMSILNKLNLNSIKKDTNDQNKAEHIDQSTEDISSDPTTDLIPEIQKDFLILVNLVEFTRNLLCNNSTESFNRWTLVFVEDIVTLSTRYPLVSGFYKLLHTSCVLLERNAYFKEHQCEDSKHQQVECYLKLFMKEVLISSQQFKDDLLLSCMRFLLSLPVVVVEKSLMKFVHVFKRTFELGLTHFEMAELALSTLEKWSEVMSRDELNVFLSHVLPSLDDYLKSALKEGKYQQEDIPFTKVTLTKSERKVKQVPIRYLKALVKANKQSLQSPLEMLKLRIIKFLGALGGSSNMEIVYASEEKSLKAAIAWDTEEFLSFSLPFPDMKAKIYLDSYLPRIVELATSSSNRQTKVVSCELLHALVLFMIGKSVHDPGIAGNKKKSMESLYKKIFPALLKLSCSAEQVAEQLFSPLLFQIIHWMTRNKRYENPETMVLLNVILDGAANPTDSGLRDFSAKCVKEFFSWSIKQSTDKQLEKNPGNPKSLFKRLYSFALHPNPFKRLGAAIIFNNIYAVFRETEALVDVFALELLVTFVKSLSMASDEESSLGTITQGKAALQHLQKIIKNKSELFLKSSKDRVVPLELRLNEVKDFGIVHINAWLMRHCCIPQMDCRRECMRLFAQFLPLQKDVDSVRGWMVQQVSANGGSFFTDKFERGAFVKNGVRYYPTLEKIAGEKPLTVHLWHENILAALDCYCWVIGDGYLTAEQLFVGNEKSVVIKSIQYFLKEIAFKSLSELLLTFGIDQNMLPSETGKFNKVKCTVIVRIIQFLTATLFTQFWKKSVNLANDVFNESLFKLVVYCVIRPSVVGFDVSDLTVIQQLPEVIEKFTEGVLKFSSPSINKIFVDECSKMLNEREFDFLAYLPLDLTNNMTSQGCFSLVQLLHGLMLLNKIKLLQQVMSDESRNSLFEALLDNLVNNFIPLQSGKQQGSLNPTVKNLAKKMLEFALVLNPASQKLANILLDTRQISNDGRPDKRGSVFYHTFGHLFNEHFKRNPDAFTSIINHGESCKILIFTIIEGILSLFLKQKSSDMKEGSRFCQALMANIGTLFGWTTEDKEDLLLFMLKISTSILQLTPDAIKEEAFFQLLFREFQNLSKTKMSIKSQAIEMIPLVLQNCSEKQLDIVCQALRSFITNTFPLSSADLTVGSTQYVEYVTLLSKLLKSMTLSASPMFFNVMISVFVRETVELYQSKMEPVLISFGQHLEIKNSVHAVFDHCINVFKDEKSYDNEIRQKVIERLCLSLLEYISIENVKEFFKRHVKYIMETLDMKFNKSNEEKFKSQLINQICCFKLMSLMYQKLDKEHFTSLKSDILLAFIQNPVSGKELTSALSRNASAAHKEDVRCETMLVELRRQYHCAAYNCLVSIISSTQTDLKFYTGLLFAENPAKGALLFENLIDLNKTYEFDTEMNLPFAKKKTLQLLRRNNSERDSAQSQTRKHRTKASVAYISTQFLMETSLSQDVSKFDFNVPIDAFSSRHSSPTNASPKEEDINEEENSEIPSPVDETPAIHHEDTVIELDELNRHESMSILLSLMKHMKENKVYTSPTQPTDTADLPSWMMFLCKKMSARDTHDNVKLFIARLLVNEPKIFEPYGKHWFSCVTEFILSGKIKGAPMNYVVVDLIVIMLSWSTHVIPGDDVVGRNLASSLLDYTIKYCHHTNRSVFKNNLQVIKTLLQVWKERLEIPYKLIHDHFKETDINTKDNATGIQLLGLVLTAGFPVFQSQSGISHSEFFLSLTQCLSFKYKEIYAASAEVCGLALDYLIKQNDSDAEELLELVQEQLLNHSRTTKDKFVECLYHMKTHYPPIIDKFISQLLYCLSCMFGTLKTQCIQCLSARVGDISPDEHQNIYKQIMGKEMGSMFTHKEEETQIASVKLVAGLLKSMTAVQMKETLPYVASIQRSDSIVLRDLTYDVFMWVFANCRDDPEQVEILQLSKEVLVLGINDAHTELSLKVLNFWRQENNLPKETIDRLIEVIRALYSNKTEKDYLSYATNLIMQLTSVSPDYTRPLFDDGLDSEENFRNYHVNFSWQRQSVAMTPLFVATQHTSSQGRSYTLTQKSSAEYGGLIRETQKTFEFTQTVQEGSLNWMNPSKQVDSQPISDVLLIRTSPSLTLLSPEPYEGMETMDTTDGSISSKQPGSDILRLKRKFLKDQRARNFQFATLEKQRQKLRDQALERRKAAKDRKVSMYRKYRVGELPDIQIKHSELIVPLQALAQLDSQIASKLFCTLFQSIVNQLPNNLAQVDIEKAYSELQEALENMLKSSTLNDPSFTHAIQDICYTTKQFKLEPNLISVVSMASMQQPVGVLLLEKQLLSNVDVVQQTKRRRVETTAVVSSEDRQTWLEIARLYESIDDYDGLRSVYTSQVSKSQRAKDALSAETQNHYDVALNFYREASREGMSDENNPTDEEEEFLDAARMRCYENLSKWTSLKDFTLQSASQYCDGKKFNPSMFWDHDNLQEMLLPYYMKSNMKLLCKGALTEVDDDFLSFVKDSLKQEHLKEHLESKYCVELALLNIFQEDYGSAQHYLNISSQQFLSEWTVLSSLVSASRQKKLEQLQRICEMTEFVDLVTSEDKKCPEKVKKVLSKWSSRLPDVKTPLLVWDDIVLARCSFIRKLKSFFQNDSGFSKELEFEETQNVLSIADVARKHGNYAMANQHLKESRIALKDGSSTDLSLRWRFIYGKLHRDKVKMFNKNTENNVKSLVSVLDQLEKCRDDSKQKLHWNIEGNLIQHDTWHSLRNSINNLEGDQLSESIKESLSALPQFRVNIPENKNEISSTCEELSIAVLNDALSLSKKLNTSVHSHRMLYEKSLMKTVLFYDEKLKEKEEISSSAECGSYAMTIVRNLLKAMEHHSEKAKSRFPRLLQLVDKYRETRELFKEQVKQLPCWMFLEWINQIVAVIDKPIQSCVKPILKNIARNYPQALIFPLRVSSEQFKFSSDVEGRKREMFFKQLLATVSSPLVEVFSDALLQLTNPPHLLEDILEEMTEHVVKRDTKNVEICFQKINKFFLGGGRGRRSHGNEPSSSPVPLEVGSLARNFGKKKDLEKEFGKDGKRIIGMNIADFEKAKKNILENEKKVNYRGNLKDFSPWLSDFQKDHHQNHLEIPGQYSGKCKPMPECHVKISGFDQAILVLSSIRKPKCITVRGDDEKEYKFLVKGGEDLRQDQRIEQVFDLMNIVIRNDPTCCKHRTTIKTYNVIPISQRVGIIEWVDNTSVYNDVVTKALSKNEEETFHNAGKKYFNKRGSNWRNYQDQCYKKEKRKDTVKFFKEVINMVPHDLLRRTFTKMASSSEAYFILRNRFIQSHSYMCIAHYILGIGDRHLSNTLIDKTTGCVVGIDFGHAFGTATQLLLTPELFPFRLTGQMLNLLQPLKDASPYKQYMMGIMQAFRKHASLLLNIMDVFVHEPLLDWQKNAAKMQQDVGAVTEQEKQMNTWYPKHKINICRLKLSGVNPAFIMSKELKEGRRRDGMKNFCEVCEGDATVNIRKEFLEKSTNPEMDFLSVEEQVDCLVDMATDQNILGRSYVGWSAWI